MPAAKPLNLTSGAAKSVQGPAPQAVKAQQLADAAVPSVDKQYPFRPMQRGERLTGVDPALPGSAAKVDAALDSYVMLEALPAGNRFNFRAACCECFWQTHQQSKESAIKSVKEHAVRHLYSV